MTAAPRSRRHELDPAHRVELERLTAAVDESAAAHEQALAELADGIRRAAASGASSRAIAPAVGRSFALVARIIRG